MKGVLATKSPGEREDAEAQRLMRPAPKKKPPRHDRRREDMRADQDQDVENDPDLKGRDRSMNYKAIGGSLIERLAARYAAEGGRIGRIPARNKQTGKVVYISEKALRENPSKYEKYKPEGGVKPEPGKAAGPGERPKPSPRKPKLSPGSPAPSAPERPKPPPRKSKPAPGQAAPKPEEGAPPAPTGAAPSVGPAQPPDDAKKAKPKKPHVPTDQKPKGDGQKEKTNPQGEPEDEPEEAPEPPIAEKLGIKPPKRREATAAEHAEAALMLADHLPSALAAQLIASNLHPDDARDLVGSYRAARSRPVGSLSAFAAKASEFYETDPDRVEPPKSWRKANGEIVPFEDLGPEEKGTAYRQHQMQVVAMSLASQHQLEEQLSFGGVVSPGVSKVVTQAMLGKLKPEAVAPVAEKIFETTAGAKDFAKVSDGTVKAMLSLVKDNDGAKALLQSYLEANDYKRAKSLYLNDKISERDKPAKIVEQLRAARDFFKVQARGYGADDDGHAGAKRFQTRTLSQLRNLSPEKYKVVRRALDEEEAKDYRKAQRQYARAYSEYERAHAEWQKAPFLTVEPKAPKQPIEPIGYSNAKNSGELADEGRQLWKDLEERSRARKTASRVASKFLISSYPSGNPMPRTPNAVVKRSLYHGTHPAEHYPRSPYPKWGPVQTRDLAETDHDVILAEARRWLSEPVSSGLEPDQKLRQALDLALSNGRYKPDVQTYALLLSKLEGTPKRADVDRERLERAVYAKFPPDSKRKQGGKPTVMLTGDVATKLKRPDFSLVALKDLSMADLETLARTMRVVTSSFEAGHPPATRGSAPHSRKPDNGASPMLRLSSEQKTEANRILASFDQLADAIQKNYRKWGMTAEAAKGIVNRLDRTADEAEALFFGGDSLRTRQAEIAIASESFVQDAVDSGLLTRAQVNKAARVIQRDSDEAYMDTFKNPMAPIETNSDEPYMSAYADDQSSAVTDGEDDTGRDLAPEA